MLFCSRLLSLQNFLFYVKERSEQLLEHHSDSEWNRFFRQGGKISIVEVKWPYNFV